MREQLELKNKKKGTGRKKSEKVQLLSVKEQDEDIICYFLDNKADFKGGLDRIVCISLTWKILRKEKGIGGEKKLSKHSELTPKRC